MKFGGLLQTSKAFCRVSHYDWLCRKLTTCLSIHWSYSVILSCLPLYGWIADIPHPFHFVIKPNGRQRNIYQQGNFHSFLCSKDDISYLRAPESDFFTNVCLQPACLGVWCYTPVAMRVIGTPELHYLDGWVNTFGSLFILSTLPPRFSTCSCSGCLPRYICQGIYFGSLLQRSIQWIFCLHLSLVLGYCFVSPTACQFLPHKSSVTFIFSF